MNDPNLEKIKNFHMSSIQTGDLGVVITQARDYLEYMNGHDHKAVERELRRFKRHLKRLHESTT